ncbi:MAG TPA: hypothetical protein VGK49_05740 [Ilumatobacteraceae bacterium]
MHQLNDLFNAVLHVIAHSLSTLTQQERSADPDSIRDRGAVSLEQVLWFVAAGVSVAVIAGILWSQIRSQASSPISTPSAP